MGVEPAATLGSISEKQRMYQRQIFRFDRERLCWNGCIRYGDPRKFVVCRNVFSPETAIPYFFFAQSSLGLERLLFDFTSSMIERAVRLLDPRISFEDLVPTLRELITRYPYERQKR